MVSRSTDRFARFGMFALCMGLGACSSESTTPTPPPPSTSPPAEGTTPPGEEKEDPQAAYPEGPYGNGVGQVLGDLDFVGYLRNETKGLATSATLAPIKLSAIRAQAGTAKYAFIHVSAFWCGICRAAVEDLVTQYPKLASKAVFVDMLVEGETPDDVATRANLDSFVKGLAIPYTVVRDPDGVTFRIREKIGKNKTALLVELSTMKVVAKSATDYKTVVSKLEALE
jgi:hypothetical protein